MSSTLDHKELIDLALKSAIQLTLPSNCVATACQYLHRVHSYIEKLTTEEDESKENFEIGNLVAAALFIATKACECETRISTIITTVHGNLVPNEPIMSVEEERYWALRQSVVHMENTVLRILDFNMTFELPHKYVMFFLKHLADWMNNEKLMEELTILSLSVLNDFYCSNKNSSKKRPQHIALACIDFAIEMIEPRMKQLIEAEQNQLWYQNFDNNFQREDFEYLKQEILSTYP